jgi:hypothetical protein
MSYECIPLQPSSSTEQQQQGPLLEEQRTARAQFSVSGRLCPNQLHMNPFEQLNPSNERREGVAELQRVPLQ